MNFKTYLKVNLKQSDNNDKNNNSNSDDLEKHSKRSSSHSNSWSENIYAAVNFILFTGVDICMDIRVAKKYK